MVTQECPRCCEKYELSSDFFYRRKDRPSGFSYVCKKCENKRTKKARDKYRNKNKKKISEINKKYREAHKKEIAKYRRRYVAENRDRVNSCSREYGKSDKRRAYSRKYRQNNRGKLIKYSRTYRANNKDKISEYWRRRRKLLKHRLHRNMQSRIQSAIKSGGSLKSNRTEDLIGCSIVDLIKHIECKMVSGMTWDNYGKEWHIDHIKPCVSFDLSDPKSQKECFNYANLQPLWTEDNLSKNSWYDGKLIRKRG